MLHQTLPRQLYTIEQTRNIDKRCCELLACSEFDLMQRAAVEALTLLQRCWPAADKLLIICGKGNNAGDGLVLAVLAARVFMQVDVYMHIKAEALTDVAKQAWQMAAATQTICWVEKEDIDAAIQQADVLVDALLGTGIRGKLSEDFAALIQTINAAQKNILALDVPSGLNADSGSVCFVAIKAAATICFIALKPGLLMHAGLHYCGELFFADLDAPQAAYADNMPVVLLDQTDVSCLAPRIAHAHKNNFGHVLIVGGDLGMGGAAILAAQAAARSGAGLVSFASQPQHLSAMLARCPDVMAHGVSSGQQLESLLEQAAVIVIGPGMSNSAWSQQMLHTCLQTNIPLVVDAGALTLLAVNPHWMLPQNCLLLPHPGEAARLLHCTTQQVQQDRIAAVQQLCRKYAAHVLLKGAGTLLANTDQTLLIGRAHPALATAGSGDVLAGIVGAFLAQGLIAQQALALAVHIHLQAAQLCTKEFAIESVLASDLLEKIPYALYR